MTDLDAWRERPCVVCQEMYVPKTQSRKDADRSKCCSPRCAAKKGAMAAKEQGAIVGRSVNSYCRELDPADLVPCTRCHIRGHVAGDPLKCIQPLASMGLGVQGWV